MIIYITAFNETVISVTMVLMERIKENMFSYIPIFDLKR